MSIVTLSHEIGAGGPEIGQKLAERLGLHCVDQELGTVLWGDPGADSAG